MACRDCKWFTPGWSDLGDCEFIELSMPRWFIENLREGNIKTSGRTWASLGEGCPQFKERNDGE